MKRIFIVLAFFLLSSGLFAGQPVIAVFHFENETQSGNYRLHDNTLRNLEEKLRSELIKTQQFEVMTNDSMEAMLAQHKAESYNLNRDKAYQIRLGQKISARYIVIGKIRNDGRDYTVFAEIIDTQRESSIGAGNANFVNNTESRDRAVNSIVTQLLGEGGKQVELKNSALRGTNSKDLKACEYARQEASVTAWASYLKLYPQGECASEAKDAIDDIACAHAERTQTKEAWQLYLKHQPTGKCAVKAEAEIRKVQRRYFEGRKIGDLIWSDRSSNKMSWSSAKQYCENLTEGGFTDWRLPTISELKTTIQNCQSGGSACRVSDNCISLNCRSESCKCNDRKHNGGYYSKLGDDDNIWLWSSSSSNFRDKEHAWSVRFFDAYVEIKYKSFDFYVRCVR